MTASPSPRKPNPIPAWNQQTKPLTLSISTARCFRNHRRESGRRDFLRIRVSRLMVERNLDLLGFARFQRQPKQFNRLLARRIGRYEDLGETDGGFTTDEQAVF